MLTDPFQIRVSDPLSSFAAGFAGELARQGYRPCVVRNHMGLLAHLSRWLMGEGLGADGLHTTEAERFLSARRAAGYTQLLSMRAMQPILAYLRGLGVVPTPPSPTSRGPVEVALERYRSYLTVERGLVADDLVRRRLAYVDYRLAAQMPRRHEVRDHGSPLREPCDFAKSASDSCSEKSSR